MMVDETQNSFNPLKGHYFGAEWSWEVRGLVDTNIKYIDFEEVNRQIKNDKLNKDRPLTLYELFD